MSNTKDLHIFLLIDIVIIQQGTAKEQITLGWLKKTNKYFYYSLEGSLTNWIDFSQMLTQEEKEKNDRKLWKEWIREYK